MQPRPPVKRLGQPAVHQHRQRAMGLNLAGLPPT